MKKLRPGEGWLRRGRRLPDTALSADGPLGCPGVPSISPPCWALDLGGRVQAWLCTLLPQHLPRSLGFLSYRGDNGTVYLVGGGEDRTRGAGEGCDPLPVSQAPSSLFLLLLSSLPFSWPGVPLFLRPGVLSAPFPEALLGTEWFKKLLYPWELPEGRMALIRSASLCPVGSRSAHPSLQ